MNKENIKKIAYFILVGLMSPLIFEPLAQIIQNAGNGILISCVNYFFHSCANSSSALVILKFTQFSYIFLIFSIIINVIRLLSNLQKQKVETINTKINNDNITPELNNEIVVKKHRKKSKKPLWFLLIYFCLFLITNTVYEYIPVIVRENFNKDIIQITPYIEEKEVDILLSKWVSMETKSDYDSIYARISEIKQKNNLK